jgi:hypothetical protein
MVTAAQAVERLGALAGLRGRAVVVDILAGLVAFATVLLLAIDDGGYFPPVWGWSAAILSWMVVIGLIARREAALGRQAGVWLAILALDTA